MTVKGHHSLAEIIGKKLFSIETVPKSEQTRMINRAIKASIEYHESEIQKVIERTQEECAKEAEYFSFNDEGLSEQDQIAEAIRQRSKE